MSTVSHTRASAFDPETIERLTTLLLTELDTNPSPGTTENSDPNSEVLSIGVTAPDATGITVAVTALCCTDPIGSLVGFVAPESWVAMGIVATGRWFPVAEADSDPVHRRRSRLGALAPGGRARVATVSTRGGQRLQVVCRDGEVPTPCWDHSDDYGGRADDVLRRALGLPTTPPRHDPRRLWAVVWCDTIAELVLSGVNEPSWTDIACIHPSISQLGLVDGDARAWAADNLIRLGADFADLHGWSDLRRLCSCGEWPLRGISADGAGWMDDGMFSRWAMEPYPELDDLLDDLDVMVSDEVSYRMWRSVDAWGLP